MWQYVYPDQLYHYGVKGMRWGIRKNRIYTTGQRSGRIGIQFFAKKMKDFKTVKLPKDEYAHVMSELMTHITDSQKQSRVVYKLIGKYLYIFENNLNGVYRIIGKKRNPGTTKRRS